MKRIHVAFESRYQNVDSYRVTINGESHRIELGPLGYRGVGREASAVEIDAIRDYLFKQEQDFEAWMKSKQIS